MISRLGVFGTLRGIVVPVFMYYEVMVIVPVRLRKWFSKLGPGFITGAADDDPSGIATYSIAGAKFGYRMNWMSLFLLPAMVAIQEMCGRIGKVTGTGLAGVVKRFYSRKTLWSIVCTLFVANVVNIGADLGIMAASIQMLLGGQFMVWLVVVGLVIVVLEVAVPYRRYFGYLKWLGALLVVYMLTGLLVTDDWGAVMRSLVVPHIELSKDYVMTMVGFIGTTISPYLFFWQASEEVEEDILKEKIRDFNERPKTSVRDIKALGWDTKVGMLFSNMVTFFIVVTTASTLYKNGIFEIETPQQAALALKPLAGQFAYLLFGLGVIGIGLQSIPVLAGSVAYAVSDALGVSEGLSKKFWQAKWFYLVIVVATLSGMLMNLLGVNVIKALYYAAVINGVVSVPLIFMIIKLADDSRVVDGFKTKPLNRVVAWVTLTFVAVSVVLMFKNFWG